MDSSWKSKSGIYHLPNIGIRTRLHLTQIQRGKALQPSCPAVYRTPCTGYSGSGQEGGPAAADRAAGIWGRYQQAVPRVKAQI